MSEPGSPLGRAELERALPRWAIASSAGGIAADVFIVGGAAMASERLRRNGGSLQATQETRVTQRAPR